MSISSILPANGTTCGGIVVTVNGCGFMSGATVTIGSAISGGTLIGSTAIYVTTVASSPGATNVIVTNPMPNGISLTLTNGYTYNMSLSSISPTNGTACGGTVVTVNGCGFMAGATVTIGNDLVGGTLIGSTAIYVTTTASSAGATNVIVTNPMPNGRSVTLANGYTYNMVVTSISPSSGPIAGGTVVTITGCGFVSAVTITIDSAAAVVATNVVGGSVLYATTNSVASGSGGTYDVVLTNPNGTKGSLIVAQGGYTYWELCISIDEANIAFGTIGAGSTVISTVPVDDRVQVTNSSTAINANLRLQISGEPAQWKASTAAGMETYVLYAQFSGAAGSTVPPAVGTYTAANHALSYTLTDCSTTKFGNGVAGEAGINIPPTGTRVLWFRFDAPTATTLTSQATITVCVTAYAP